MTAEVRFFVILTLTLITFTVGVFNLKKLPSVKSKLIVFALALGFFADLLGNYFTQLTGWLNYSIYNSYTVISFLLYYFIILNLLSINAYRRIARWIIFSFSTMSLSVVIFFFDTFINGISSVIYTLAVLGLLVMSILYLIELYNSDKILHVGESIFFWFVVGVLIFHVPFLPFMLSVKFFLIDFDPKIYTMILILLNVFMSSCFIYGFVCSKKIYNY